MKKKIVKFFVTVIASMSIAGTVTTAANAYHQTTPTDTASGYYSTAAEAVKIDRKHDTVTVKDANGNLWEFYGIEDYEKKDLICMLMDNNGTPENIYDDIIVATRFSGYTIGQ